MGGLPNSTARSAGWPLDDTGAAWLVRLGHWSGHSPNTGKTYEREPIMQIVDSGDPSFVVTGSARDLHRWLWNRPTDGDVKTDGDVAAFVDVIRSGVQ